MIGPEFIIVAIALRLMAGASYLIATWKGTVQPNPVTWLFWGLAPLIAFAAQAQGTLEPSAWVSLVLGIGPLLIFGVSLGRGTRWRVSVFDILCGASALVGIVLWQITSDPTVALWFGIIADILGGIPTVRKSYSAPQSEKAFPYFLSITSMVVTLLTIKEWQFLIYGFPFYILLINVVLFSLIASRIGVRMQQRSRRRQPSASITSA